jgi:hypothetical protein
MVAREVEGEVILVPIRQKAGDLQSIYSLNEVASFIWQQVDGERTDLEIRDLVVSEFDVSPEQAATDLQELMQQLEASGAVKVAQDEAP